MERRLKQYEPLFGGWYVNDKIGSGSYGHVYRLTSRDLFGKTFSSALKVIEILPEEEILEDPARVELLMRKKYLNEVGLLDALHGVSHVVNIEDQALMELREDGRLVGYDLLIRMELLDSVHQLLKTGDKSLYSVAEARHLGRDICHALIHCHQEGILHRDINPNNIFRNRLGEYKLGDFGISKHLSGAMRAKTRIGTKRYTAPEVIAGEPYDVRADLYSLGLVLYQLTNSGFQPFLSAGATREEVEHAQERRLNGEPLPPPSQADEAMTNIILKACAFDPEDRFETAQDMYDALAGTAKVSALPDFWWRSIAPRFSLLGSFGLTPRDTWEMRYMADLLSADDTQKLVADGVLTKYMADGLPRWRIKRAWLPINRLTLDQYTELKARAFDGRADLVAVHCGGMLKTIGSRAFRGCVNLAELELEDGVQRILSGAFSGCVKLTECCLPASIRTLGDGAFSGCELLQTVHLPDSLHGVSAKLFAGCASLHHVKIPASVRSIGEMAFRDSGLGSISLPDTCPRVSDAAFLGCRRLMDVQLSAQSTVIPKSCFSGCTSLSHIALPSLITEIRGRAFYNCASLERIVLPNGVRRIGAQAFAQCDAMTTIVLPDSLEQIGEDAFGSGGFLKNKFGKLTVIAKEGSIGWQYCKKNGIRVREP